MAKLHQFIDGIDSTTLKNYLFCQKNKIIIRESEIWVRNKRFSTNSCPIW